MMANPQPGTYIRPVGFSYCLEVIRTWDGSDGVNEGIEARRHGLSDEKQPCNDGLGRGSNHFLSGLIEVIPGVWRDPWEFNTRRWSCCPLYYRRIDVGGQMELF